MQKTQHYQLNQWDAQDSVIRTDFNADNAKIDAALSGLQTAINVEQMVVGSYVGDGAATRTVQLPFAPRFAIVFGYYSNDLQWQPLLYTQGFNLGFALNKWEPPTRFYLEGDCLHSTNPSYSNTEGTTYYYVLFR